VDAKLANASRVRLIADGGTVRVIAMRDESMAVQAGPAKSVSV